MDMNYIDLIFFSSILSMGSIFNKKSKLLLSDTYFPLTFTA